MAKTAALQMNLSGLRHVLDDMASSVSSGDYTGVLGACDLGLFTSWPGFTSNIQLADITEATFVGYARQLVTWGAPYDNSGNQAAMTSGDHVFRPTDATVPETVIGAFLVDDEGNLVAIGAFDVAIPMQSDLDQAAILVTMMLSTVLEMGSAVAVD